MRLTNRQKDLLILLLTTVCAWVAFSGLIGTPTQAPTQTIDTRTQTEWQQDQTRAPESPAP